MSVGQFGRRLKSVDVRLALAERRGFLVASSERDLARWAFARWCERRHAVEIVLFPTFAGARVSIDLLPSDRELEPIAQTRFVREARAHWKIRLTCVGGKLVVFYASTRSPEALGEWLAERIADLSTVVSREAVRAVGVMPIARVIDLAEWRARRGDDR